MAMSFKAVIFDIDDTLISEYDYVLSGYRQVSKRLAGDDDISLDESGIFDLLLETSRGGFLYVYNRLFEKLGLPDDKERIGELIRIYQGHDPDIRLYDDVDETLVTLRERGIKLGVISDGDPARQHRKLKKCDAEKYFDCVIVTDELGGEEYRKPDRRSFDKMKESLGVDFKDMMYVGDNPSKDFYIKKTLPVKTARIIRPHGIYADRDYREGIKEDYKLDSLKDLLNICL
ncbi:MAG: HAD-IA family hydrolase [Lachnospiraceae bacterium]|nr:HAD-IA family hydrolase [Lachnospiraceae bacterium]